MTERDAGDVEVTFEPTEAEGWLILERLATSSPDTDVGELLPKLERMIDAIRQMRARSGPLYEISQRRSRIVAEAYRVAGSPRHVSIVRTQDGWEYRHIVTKGRRRGELECATEDEWRAWRTWAGARHRLREEMRRSGSSDQASALNATGGDRE